MGLSTGVGVVKLQIRYGLDPGTGRWGSPLRQRWGLGPHQEMSPALEDKLAFTVTATRSYERRWRRSGIVRWMIRLSMP